MSRAAARARSGQVALDLGTTSPLAIANSRRRKRAPSMETEDACCAGVVRAEMKEAKKRARRPRAPIIPKALYVVPRMPLPVCGIDPSLTHSAGHFALLDELHRSFSKHGFSLTHTHKKLSRFSIRTDPNAFANRLARLDAMRAAFLTELGDLTRTCGPGLLVVEGYAFGARFGKIADRYEWGGQLRLSAYCMGWDVVEVNPTMLKRWTAADGAAKKLDMMLAVEKRWGYKSTDDNDADAFALSQLGSAFIKWRLGATVTSEEAEQFARLEVWEAKARQA